MYFPRPRTEYSDAYTFRFDASGVTKDSIVDFIDFTQEFKYLVSIVHYSLTSSDTDVDIRIKSAIAASGRLKCVYQCAF